MAKVAVNVLPSAMSSGGGLTVSIALPSVFPVLIEENDRKELSIPANSAVPRDISFIFTEHLVPDPSAVGTILVRGSRSFPIGGWVGGGGPKPP